MCGSGKYSYILPHGRSLEIPMEREVFKLVKLVKGKYEAKLELQRVGMRGMFKPISLPWGRYGYLWNDTIPFCFCPSVCR